MFARVLFAEGHERANRRRSNSQVRHAMADKYAQINRYLEIFTHLAKDCGWTESRDRLTIADMGCGKGYLTFGLWHLFARFWKRPVRVIGVEARPALAGSANALARAVAGIPKFG